MRMCLPKRLVPNYWLTTTYTLVKRITVLQCLSQIEIVCWPCLNCQTQLHTLLDVQIKNHLYSDQYLRPIATLRKASVAVVVQFLSVYMVDSMCVLSKKFCTSKRLILCKKRLPLRGVMRNRQALRALYVQGLVFARECGHVQLSQSLLTACVQMTTPIKS